LDIGLLRASHLLASYVGLDLLAYSVDL